MREIKFRQPIFVKGEFAYWYFWGFTSDNQFTGPETHSSTIERARKTSQQFTGRHDKLGQEIYEGDLIWVDATDKVIAEAAGVTAEVVFERGAFRFECCPGFKKVLDDVEEFVTVIGNNVQKRKDI